MNLRREHIPAAGTNLWQALVNLIAGILRFFYELTVSIGFPSYAVAIIILTLVIKLILYPLTHRQMHSMKKMQGIQPKIQEIQLKYKNNPEIANQLIMEMYKENNVNPLAGCLPLLLQMPILYALFQTLQKFQYSDIGAGFFWITHLKNPDPIVLPIIVALTTFLQSKITTPAGAKTDGSPASSQKMMLYFMPLFIGWLSRSFPAGLSIYWIFSNTFGILQQMYINRQPAIQKGEVGIN